MCPTGPVWRPRCVMNHTGVRMNVFVQELTSCGTWMKANVYSVACGGSVRVLKAGGRAARRVEDNISLWKDKRERSSHCCVIKQASYLFHTLTACTRSSLNGGGVSTAQQIKAKSRITLNSSTCHTRSQQHNMRDRHSVLGRSWALWSCVFSAEHVTAAG